MSLIFYNDFGYVVEYHKLCCAFLVKGNYFVGIWQARVLKYTLTSSNLIFDGSAMVNR